MQLVRGHSKPQNLRGNQVTGVQTLLWSDGSSLTDVADSQTPQWIERQLLGWAVHGIMKVQQHFLTSLVSSVFGTCTEIFRSKYFFNKIIRPNIYTSSFASEHFIIALLDGLNCFGKHSRELRVPVGHVTESGVRLLAAQKPIKKQGWWKGKFALFWIPATGGGEGRRLSEGWLPPTDSQWARAFIDRGRGLHAITAQSALTVILKLVMQRSDPNHLDCFQYS